MDNGKNFIELNNIVKAFGETKALRGCSFSARGGEVHAIVGENGSGKSTLAKIISGVVREDAGNVRVLGGRPRNPIEAQTLGVATIFQEVLLADEASVADNLFVGADGFLTKRISAREKQSRTREMMRRFTGRDIPPWTRVGTLPLSVKQWIVIGRALLRQPKVLILDESSAALDLEATERLHHEISRLREVGACVVLVTHRIAELVRIADRATILRDGVAVGTLDKSALTEQNLLALMTPQDRQIASLDRRQSPVIKPPLMTMSSVQLTEKAQTFDFKIGPGQIVGVTGLDGQGHELFATAAAGISKLETGAPLMHLAGGAIQALRNATDADAFGVAYVSGDRKSDGIFPNLSIFENLAISLYRQNTGPLGLIRRKTLEQAFASEVRRLSIKTGHSSNKITSLSGGNQQKVLIGRAFARDPQLIVLNDPARGVDLGTKRDLYRELRNYADAGGAVIYLSSEIEEFLGFADRVDVFVNGSLFRSLEGDNIAEAPILSAMFGHADHAGLQAVTEGMVQ
ncbi:sugar ABC transporter ATP-binding protein [Mesorhizobium sp. M1D.F.Ca.ET.043.01.1.1]|uniref:sugar ABC transporter ATP-binding protein n=1 Tax=Mesorhizobium sp. M1D.F.Ca.ET.043.01.1.1 TaxID=2493669 RepID=UPI001FE0F5AF|nr:sugar ABC transporter ATP-binding protein [Mesorhizobium sp. M1D.F.Ca.ET.043.01.1.1]